jgi:DHA1 family multidrug resistance protein-like MFS transporter
MLSSSTFIGISLGPMFGGLLSEWIGFRLSFLIGGAMLSCGFLLVLLLVREDGTSSAGDEEDKAGGRGTHPRPGRSGRRIASLVTLPMLGLFGLLLLLRFVRTLPIPFLPLFIQEMRGELGRSASTTGLVSAGRGVVTALAAITITRFGDRHKRLVVVGALVGLSAVFSLPLFFTSSVWSFAVFLMIATFFMGGVEPLVQADLSSRVPPARRGLLFGLQTSVGNMGWFAAPVVGTFVSIRYGIAHIYLTLAILLFVTMGIVFAIHFRSRKNTGHVNRSS